MLKITLRAAWTVLVLTYYALVMFPSFRRRVFSVVDMVEKKIEARKEERENARNVQVLWIKRESISAN